MRATTKSIQFFYGAEELYTISKSLVVSSCSKATQKLFLRKKWYERATRWPRMHGMPGCKARLLLLLLLLLHLLLLLLLLHLILLLIQRLLLLLL